MFRRLINLSCLVMVLSLVLASQAKIPISTMNLTRYDLFTSDECFLSGTAAEIIAVVKIDGRVIGDGKPGEVTQSLRSSFRKLVESGD